MELLIEHLKIFSILIIATLLCGIVCFLGLISGIGIIFWPLLPIIFFYYVIFFVGGTMGYFQTLFSEEKFTMENFFLNLGENSRTIFHIVENLLKREKEEPKTP